MTRAASIQSFANVISNWRRDLKTYVVRRGTEVVCGTSTFETDPAIAADFSIVRAGLRMTWLRTLGAARVKSFTATSGLGHRFVCHVGDIAEYPFYFRKAYEKELELCAAWLRQDADPVMYDIGANDGFFCSQLAQMLADQRVQIYAVEPVPQTFAKLVQSVRRLELEDRVQPIAAAIVDISRLVSVRFSRGKSLLSKVDLYEGNGRAAVDQTAICAGITLDELCSRVEMNPSLVKIDVEGSEAAALRGAKKLLSGCNRPAILFEYSPFTLKQSGENPGSLVELLCGSELYYVDDLVGQKMPFGATVEQIDNIQWTCNLFAVPRTSNAARKWASALLEARRRLGLAASQIS